MMLNEISFFPSSKIVSFFLFFFHHESIHILFLVRNDIVILEKGKCLFVQRVVERNAEKHAPPPLFLLGSFTWTWDRSRGGYATETNTLLFLRIACSGSLTGVQTKGIAIFILERVSFVHGMFIFVISKVVGK